MKCKHCGSEIAKQIGKTIKIKELNIELMPKQQQNKTLYKDIKYPKGWRLIHTTEIMRFWDNKKFRDAVMKANDNDVWFFVENLDIYKKDFVARFIADSVRANFNCYGSPGVSVSRLGVIFVRDLK